MDVLADTRTVLHRIDHRLPEVLGVRAREADPLDARYSVARAQELAELHADLGCEVSSPRIDVLAQERHLADATVGEPGDLGDDVSRTAALLATANRRHDAVRAHGVAAH